MDRLIAAYRKEIYDWNYDRLKKLFKAPDGVIVLAKTILWFAVCIGLSILCATHHRVYLSGLFLLIELAGGMYVEHALIVKNEHYLSREKAHLEKVKSLLESPELNLFSEKKIDYIIDRLSENAGENTLYETLKKWTGNFLKILVLPAVTFIAGVYSQEIANVPPATAILVCAEWLATIAAVFLMFAFIWYMVKKAGGRDREAGAALQKDLHDIKLFYFV